MWNVFSKPKPKTLLQKAKEYNCLRRPQPVYICSPEEVEAALAWAKGEITLAQFGYATGDLKYHKPNAPGQKPTLNYGANAYVLLARSLRQYIKDNKL